MLHDMNQGSHFHVLSQPGRECVQTAHFQRAEMVCKCNLISLRNLIVEQCCQSVWKHLRAHQYTDPNRHLLKVAVLTLIALHLPETETVADDRCEQGWRTKRTVLSAGLWHRSLPKIPYTKPRRRYQTVGKMLDSLI